MKVITIRYNEEEWNKVLKQQVEEFCNKYNCDKVKITFNWEYLLKIILSSNEKEKEFYIKFIHVPEGYIDNINEIEE